MKSLFIILATSISAGLCIFLGTNNVGLTSAGVIFTLTVSMGIESITDKLQDILTEIRSKK